MDPLTVELRDFERRFQTPSFMVGERGAVPDGIEPDALERWRELYRQHGARAFDFGAVPGSAPVAPYVRRAVKAKDPDAKAPAPLWRRA